MDKFKCPFVHIFTFTAFLVNAFAVTPLVQADDFRLPAPGVMVCLSPPLDPPILKGIKVHPDNSFRFDFILDKGDSQLGEDPLKNESTKLIKYFLASLTIPEKDLWVNLSPYEKDRIIPQSFGLTEMGRDLLAEDYMLKQITASLIYPEGEVGKKFWKRIYEEAAQKFGTTNVPVNTFNKVWILPEKAVVFENAKAGTAYVVESKLKVMLEEDYLSLAKHEGIESKIAQTNSTHQIGSQVVREIVIPALTKEVNENKNFAKLRQVYNSLILATWYKKKIRDSILSQVYADKNKVLGVNIDDLKEKEKIYRQYLRAFKKGVFNFIKEDVDPVTKEIIPRKYFSGGVSYFRIDKAMAVINKPSILKNILRASLSTLLLVTASCSMGASTDQLNKVHSNQQIQLIADQTRVFQDERERSAFAGTGQVVSKLEDARAKPLAVATIAGDIAFHFKDRSKTAEDDLKTEKIAQGYQYALPSDLTVQEARQLMESIRGLPVGDQSLSGVISQSILPWTARPPQESLQRQMEILTGDPSSQMPQETSIAVARAVEGIKIELGTLLYWRGVQIFSQELSDGKIDLKNLQENIQKAEGLGEQEISDAQEKAIHQIVAMMRRLPGGVDISFKEAIPQSFPQIGRVTGEINCVLRSALAAFYLHNLGIRVWSLRMSGHQTLLAQLHNGQYLIVEPSSPKIYPFSIAKVNLPFSAQALEFGKFVYLDEYHQDVFVYNWRKGITVSFYNNLAGALSDIGKWNEAVAVYDRAIALSPLEPNLYNNKAITLRMMGKMSEAADAYYRAIVLSFKSVDSSTKITLMGAVALVGIFLILKALKKAKALLKDRAMKVDQAMNAPANQAMRTESEHMALGISQRRSEEIKEFDDRVHQADNDQAKIEILVKALAYDNEPGITGAMRSRAKDLLALMYEHNHHVQEIAEGIAKKLDDELITTGSSRVHISPEGQVNAPPYEWGLMDFFHRDQYFRAMSLAETGLMAEFGSMYANSTNTNLDVYNATNMGTWADARLKKGAVVLIFNLPEHRLGAGSFGPSMAHLGNERMSQAYIDKVQQLGGDAVQRLDTYLRLLTKEGQGSQLSEMPAKYVDMAATLAVNEKLVDEGKMSRKSLDDLKVLLEKMKEWKDRQLNGDYQVLNMGNPAQLTSPLKGGIDLSPANMHLQTQNAGESIKFHLDPAQLAQLQNAPGFVPVIINIQPMRNLREFLGVT